MNFEEIYKNVPKPHIPEQLPVELSTALYDCEIIKLISKANNAMGAYNGFLINTINPMLLISPLVSQEAVLSSKLEGTHATIEDFINYDAGNEVSVSKDEMQEIMNYMTELSWCIQHLFLTVNIANYLILTVLMNIYDMVVRFLKVKQTLMMKN